MVLPIACDELLKLNDVKAVMMNWAGANQLIENSPDELTSIPPHSTLTVTSVPKKLIDPEVQGWVIGEEGEVIPPAQALIVTLQSFSLIQVVSRNGL